MASATEPKGTEGTDPSDPADVAAEAAVPHGPGSDGYEVRLADKAARDRSAVEHGRRIGGVAGAAMAGAMIAIRDIIETPKDDQAVAVSESPDEPHDVDRDGVHLGPGDVGGEVEVAVAALAPRALVEARRRSRRRGR